MITGVICLVCKRSENGGKCPSVFTKDKKWHLQINQQSKKYNYKTFTAEKLEAENFGIFPKRNDS